MIWLVIGSSPSVVYTLPRVVESFAEKPFKVITCNSGISLWPVPDFYVAVDEKASVWRAPFAKHAQQHGTKLITLDRCPQSLKDRDVDWYDEFVTNGKGKPTRTAYGAFAYSGPLCVEYACHHGAKQIHLVGMDGYRKGIDDDHFDAGEVPRTKSADAWAKCTLEHIQPRMQDLAAVWSEIKFIQYGDPCYEVLADNYLVIRSDHASLA